MGLGEEKAIVIFECDRITTVCIVHGTFNVNGCLI